MDYDHIYHFYHFYHFFTTFTTLADLGTGFWFRGSFLGSVLAHGGFGPVLAQGASFGPSFGPGGNRQNEYSDDPGWKHQKVHSCDQAGSLAGNKAQQTGMGAP